MRLRNRMSVFESIEAYDNSVDRAINAWCNLVYCCPKGACPGGGGASPPPTLTCHLLFFISLSYLQARIFLFPRYTYS